MTQIEFYKQNHLVLLFIAWATETLGKESCGFN